MDEFHSERVLVVPTELFRRIGYFQGFCGDVVAIWANFSRRIRSVFVSAAKSSKTRATNN